MKSPKIKLHHGDYRDTIKRVKADLIFTSPPYNIGSKSSRKDGLRKYGKFDPKSFGAITDYPDNLPEEIYQQQQVEFLRWCVKRLNNDGIIVYNHKPRRKKGSMIHPMTWISQVESLDLMEEIIWDRGSTHNHSKKLIYPCTERLYVLKSKISAYKFTNTKDLAFRSDVWRINKAKSNGHNAPFPEKLAEAVILAWSGEGDTVVDPFMGSGTTAIVSKRLRRNFVGSEINETYYELSYKGLRNA